MSEPSAVRPAATPAATTTDGADGPLPARLDPATAPAFSRYRIMAFVTGGFLLLLVLEMTLKYVFHAAGVDETVHIDTAMGKGHAHRVALDAGASASHDDGVGARLHGHAILRAEGFGVGERGIDGGHQGAGR